MENILTIEKKVDYKQFIDEGKEEEIEITGYVESPVGRSFFYIISFVTLGFTWLLVRWKPLWKLRLTCFPCLLDSATILLCKDLHGQLEITTIKGPKKVKSNRYELIPNDYEFDEGDSLSEHRQLVSGKDEPDQYFFYHSMKYAWNCNSMKYEKLSGLDQDIKCSHFFEKWTGLSEEESLTRIKTYGFNLIDIQVKSYPALLIDEVLNPFYIFQAASITLWSLDNYYYYATCILIISLISISISLYETKKQMLTLRDMVSQSNSSSVNVLRAGKEEPEEIPAANLVPGDVLVIPAHGCLLTCDAVLTAGNCIVNEAMLTGESVPETKTPLPKGSDDEIYCPIDHRRHTLFSGTHVIQTRYYGNSKVTAVVIRTGFSTSKGDLIRSILFPKPMGFKFYRDSMRFVLLLFALATLGMFYSLYLYIERQASWSETLKKALDIVTIVVPPALPAALTVGTVYSQSRLKKKGIFCISPPRINVSGKIKLMCFDKTGTLTEDGLELLGVIPVQKKVFESLIKEPSFLPVKSPLIGAMATCHSLTMIDGELSGDPLDLKMFAATKWELNEPGSDNTRFDLLPPTVVRPLNSHLIPSAETFSLEGNLPFEIGIVRQFPFSSSLQRMSVICRTLGSKTMDIYVKGAPEKIESLCKEETVPDDFNDMLRNYTLQGYRVIAIGFRSLEANFTWRKSQRVKREVVERDLIFLGLLIMQNALKKETTPVIHSLRNANIRMVMITGDNLLTALSVAHECCLVTAKSRVLVVEATEGSQVDFRLVETMEKEIDESSTTYSPLYHSIDVEDPHPEVNFAMDGKSFASLKTHHPNLLLKFLIRGAVFARMSPDQKTYLVELLQSLGYVVGMCGDGANDCGALKAADIGISLSEAEASVAAPFTSNIPNIECVPIVMKEGRCALVTAFSLFKFIALYSIIQFISVLILYKNFSNLGDAMFLYIDLAVITSLAIVMGNTKAYPKLVSQRPLSNLMNISNLTSMMMQILLVALFQMGAIFFLSSQKWYRPNKEDKDGEMVIRCWESTTIFLCSSFQYLVVAIVFSKGPPFRQPLYTNYFFLAIVIVLFSFSTFLIFNPWKSLGTFFELMNWQHQNQAFYFRLTLFLMVLHHLVLAVGIEILISRGTWLKTVSHFVRRKTEPKNKYKQKDMNDLQMTLSFIQTQPLN